MNALSSQVNMQCMCLNAILSYGAIQVRTLESYTLESVSMHDADSALGILPVVEV